MGERGERKRRQLEREVERMRRYTV